MTASTEFVQGKTWRWAVAWSFDETLKDKVGGLGVCVCAKERDPHTLT